jgi:hypothetical protein
MRNIVELAMLIRGSVRLPGNLELVTEELGEGWSFVQSGDSHWLDKEIRVRGWHFNWIAEELLRSGVGKTSQEAIASALKLALRRVRGRFNAARVEHFGVTKYPGFFLARVKIIRIRFSRVGFCPCLMKPYPFRCLLRQRWLRSHAAKLQLQFNS